MRVEGKNSFKIPEPPEVSFGIGISIKVEFVPEGAPPPTILFTSAGAASSMVADLLALKRPPRGAAHICKVC